MSVLPWVVTSLVALGCAGCLVHFGHRLDQVEEKVARFEQWTTRPTPFVRQKGRHAAPAVSRGERG